MRLDDLAIDRQLYIRANDRDLNRLATIRITGLIRGPSERHSTTRISQPSHWPADRCVTGSTSRRAPGELRRFPSVMFTGMSRDDLPAEHDLNQRLR